MKLGTRQVPADFIRPFLAALFILLFLARSWASETKLLQIPAALLALVLPFAAAALALVSSYFIAAGAALTYFEFEAFFQSYPAEMIGYAQSSMLRIPNLLATGGLFVLTGVLVALIFRRTRQSAASSRPSWRRVGIPVLLLIAAVALAAQVRPARLYFSAKAEYQAKLEAFNLLLAARSQGLEALSPADRQKIIELFERTSDDPAGYYQLYDRDPQLFSDLVGNLVAAGGAGAEAPRKTEQGELHVLIIGESASRDFMQAYSGLGNNTPWLESMKERPDTVLFSKAYATHVSTVSVLTHSLTTGRLITGSTYPFGPTIISLSQKAGFHTVWFSAQNIQSVWDSPTSAIAQSADETFHVTKEFRDVRDEELLPLIRNYLRTHDFDRNTLMVIHLMGSHVPFKNKYPENYPPAGPVGPGEVGARFFESEIYQTFGEYLTSIKYTDDILRDICGLFMARGDRVTSITYFSDHGEQPAEDVPGHRMMAHFTWSMVHIPLFTWLSEGYLARYPDKYEILKRHKDRLFTNDLILDYYLGLAQIQSRERLARFDPGDPDYGLNIDNAVIAKALKPLGSDPALTIPVNYAESLEKGPVLAGHRVNSLYKLRQLIGATMTRAEVDLMLAPGPDGSPATGSRLLVGHNEEEPTGLDFETYLKQAGALEFLWLDIKNLQASTAPAILAALTRLDEQYNLKARVLVEATDPAALPIFIENGWTTAYGLDTAALVKAAEKPEEMEALLAQIGAEVKKYKLAGLSYAIEGDELVQRELKPLLPPGLKNYSWEYRWSLGDPDLPAKTSAYGHLGVLLVTFPSNF